MTTSQGIIQLVNDWIRMDRDPDTKAEIEDLLSRGALPELQQRFIPRIAFGTAGLRARVEGGFGRMNSLVVIQTSQGLAQYLINTIPRARDAGVVIGFDGRKDSRRFAELTAAAFVTYGFQVIWYGEPVHTPLVPFGVRESKAVAGVMITASHNPKDDNGYKVYAANGCQINDPEDKLIADAILSNLEPLSWDVPDLPDSREQMANAYFRRVAGLGLVKTIPRFMYTPMHGVGLRYLQGALRQLVDPENAQSNMNLFEVVEEQATPDAAFPTVKFPNPEEAGALDLAKRHADAINVDFIIANDPDADRLAIAQKLKDGWHQFTGDELGVLLGYYIYQTRKDTMSKAKMVMLNSAVSSQMLWAIGKGEGFDVQETLTGFKWLGNHALKLGERALFAYEEALGYLIPSVGYDKDGIAAAVLLLQACVSWASLPYTILQGLYAKYGYFETMNTYWASPDISLTKATFDRILFRPGKLTSAIGSSVECRVRNLVQGTDTATPDGKALLPSSPENLMMTFWLSGDQRLCEGARCTIRASGTEPKLKVYVEGQSKVSKDAARAAALVVLKAVRQVYFQDLRLVMENKYELESRP